MREGRIGVELTNLRQKISQRNGWVLSTYIGSWVVGLSSELGIMAHRGTVCLVLGVLARWRVSPNEGGKAYEDFCTKPTSGELELKSSSNSNLEFCIFELCSRQSEQLQDEVKSRSSKVQDLVNLGHSIRLGILFGGPRDDNMSTG